MTALNCTSIVNCMTRTWPKHRMDPICVVIIANTIRTRWNNIRSIWGMLISHTINQSNRLNVAGAISGCGKFRDSIRISAPSIIRWRHPVWHCHEHQSVRVASTNANAKRVADGWAHPLRSHCIINRMPRHGYLHVKSVQPISSEFDLFIKLKNCINLELLCYYGHWAELTD